MQQSYGEAFAEVVSRSVIPRSTGLGDHGKQLLHNPPPAAAHSLYYTATHTHKNSTEKNTKYAPSSTKHIKTHSPHITDTLTHFSSFTIESYIYETDFTLGLSQKCHF